MPTMKIILNPVAGRGYGARVEPLLRRYLADAGVDFDLELTTHRGHATELTAQAVTDGYEMIVAAGGDGTSNEVVNGLVSAGNDDDAPVMGVIPVGSGSDFAHAVGVSPDLKQACQQLADGRARAIDVGRVSLPGQAPRYFDNTVGIGFDGIVTYEALKVKRLRGMALYLPVVLKTVFLYGKSPVVNVAFDGEAMELPIMMVTIANGPREGGGFFVAPGAQPDDGLFDLCITRELGRLATLALIPHFMNGTHIDREPVTMRRAKRISISSPDPLIVHMDGEMLCTNCHQLEFDILPKHILVNS